MCSEGEFESPRKRQKFCLSWDMEGNEADRREVMKELNCQVALHSDVFGYHFEGTVSEGDKMKDPKKINPSTALDEDKNQAQRHNWSPRCKSQIMEHSVHEKNLAEECRYTKERKKTPLQIQENVERNFKAAERRSRKGTPYRRKEKRDGMPVGEEVDIHGNLNRQFRSNDRHHNWPERTSIEYRNTMMISEPGREPWKFPPEENVKLHCWQDHQEDIPQFPGSLGKERMIPEDNSIHERHLDSQTFTSVKDIGNQSYEQKHTSLGHHLTANQIIKKGGMKFVDPRLRGDGSRRPPLSVERERCAQGETAAFIMSHGMANGLERGIPFYSPVRFKQKNSDEMLSHPKLTGPVSLYCIYLILEQIR